MKRMLIIGAVLAVLAASVFGLRVFAGSSDTYAVKADTVAAAEARFVDEDGDGICDNDGCELSEHNNGECKGECDNECGNGNNASVGDGNGHHGKCPCSHK